MGFWNRLLRPLVKEMQYQQNIEASLRTSEAALRPSDRKIDAPTVVVGASNINDEQQIQSFNNSNITFNGNLAGYDYDKILRDKQNNMNDLYKLSDYYTDADPIVRGIIKHVYVPYSHSPWVLSGARDKTCKLYEEHYKKMRLQDKIEGIFLEYWKYGNVYIYIHKGQLIT